jgi:hypothetical protein
MFLVSCDALIARAVKQYHPNQVPDIRCWIKMSSRKLNHKTAMPAMPAIPSGPSTSILPVLRTRAVSNRREYYLVGGTLLSSNCTPEMASGRLCWPGQIRSRMSSFQILQNRKVVSWPSVFGHTKTSYSVEHLRHKGQDLECRRLYSVLNPELPPGTVLPVNIEL